jgi:nicotinate phosphoribosyltransferase
MNAERFAGPLFTDLYELTMAAVYFQEGLTDRATFSMFLRPQPQRGYFVAAGLEELLDALEAYRFDPIELEYLAGLGKFTPAFLDYLAALRFDGTVRAVPEGTPLFPDEPLAEITAPVIQGQLLETFALNILGLQTMLATKAARCVQAAAGRPLVDFALRRTQGLEAGLRFARASYLAGFAATSNVLAGQRYGIPVAGTMAHSLVQAFPDEEAAFAAYARSFPDGSVFLIDTYDTCAGARHAARVAADMRRHGHRVLAVRLDSGDLALLSRQVRRILDDAGFPEIQILASSGLDEYAIADLLARGAAIDSFGVGTKAGVSADAPFLDIVYKLVSLNGRPIFKRSPGKATLAGAKQVFRRCDASGGACEDVLGLRDEQVQDGRPLLETVMEEGRRLRPAEGLSVIRARVVEQCAALPDGCRRLDRPAPYPVRRSPGVQSLQGLAESQAGPRPSASPP